MSSFLISSFWSIFYLPETLKSPLPFSKPISNIHMPLPKGFRQKAVKEPFGLLQLSMTPWNYGLPPINSIISPYTLPNITILVKAMPFCNPCTEVSSIPLPLPLYSISPSYASQRINVASLEACPPVTIYCLPSVECLFDPLYVTYLPPNNY